jgi:hypothetical protein
VRALMDSQVLVSMLTKEDRRRIGLQLRSFRVRQELDQTDVVNDKAAHGLSLGTLQAIEGNWYNVRIDNIEKYARFFQTTIADLLAAQDVPSNLLLKDLKDLHEEHLDIARQYRNARKKVRDAVELLLSKRDDLLAKVVLTLDRSPEFLHSFAELLSVSPETRDLVLETLQAELQSKRPDRPASSTTHVTRIRR